MSEDEPQFDWTTSGARDDLSLVKLYRLTTTLEENAVTI